MDDFQSQTLWGEQANPSVISSGWDPAGQTPDWGRIIANDVQATVQHVIGAAVGEKVNSGQIGYYGTPQARNQSLLIIAALLFFLVH